MMPNAQGTEVVTVGLAAAAPWNCMVNLTAGGGGTASREPARTIAGRDKLAQAFWHRICAATVIQQFTGGRFRDDASNH